MGVRPPQQDDAEPTTVAFGIAALDEHLNGATVAFPVDASGLVEALDDPEIPYDAKGSTVALSSVLAETPAEHFENRQDLMNTLHPVFEAKRERASNSLVGQLRSLLPF